MLRVAVVGSGPAGLYTAEALIKQAALLPVPITLKVDVFDRLPTPYGLVRYGVAPDHKSIKSVANYLRRVLESPDVRFVGGVTLGVDVTREELLAAYDAVVYATGAMRDRRLGIDGEDLPGSYAATDFVNWYCGHPDVDPDAFTLDAESVAVIGVGNVAVDVARILARDPAELEATDIPEPVMAALRASRVREVHVIGRRGPAQAKFTTKELRELGELAGVDVSVPAREFDLEGGFDRSGESAALAAADRRVRGNLVAMAGWSGTANSANDAAADRDAADRAAAATPTPTVDGTATPDATPDATPTPTPTRDGEAGRKLRLRFWLRPVEIEKAADGTVGGIRLERTRLTENGEFEGTGEFETIDAQMVLRSVGYQSVPLPGVPFDPKSHTVPNAAGRVLSETGEPLPGEYVAGWLKRGPTGVIGTNKADAAETVQALLADLAGGPARGETPLPRPGLLRLPGSPDASAPASVGAAGAVGAAEAVESVEAMAEVAAEVATDAANAAAANAALGAEASNPASAAQAVEEAEADEAVAEAAAEVAAEAWALADLLAARGVDHVTYEAWLRVSAAEEELARSLGRGDRVKLPHRDAVWSAARG
jgi:ferredoxin/flavodoxin---NADP+ reductase